jgi:hypothetical protein
MRPLWITGELLQDIRQGQIVHRPQVRTDDTKDNVDTETMPYD